MSKTKFKVLLYNEKLLSFLGISVQRPHEFFTSVKTYYVFFCAIVLNIISSTAFVYQNWSNFGVSLEAVSLIVVGYQYGGMFLSVGLEAELIQKLHHDIQELVENGARNFVFTEINVGLKTVFWSNRPGPCDIWFQMFGSVFWAMNFEIQNWNPLEPRN